MHGSNENIDDLLTRYLFGELEAHERSFIVRWINQSRDNRRYFDELKATVELVAGQEELDKISTDEEWNHLQQLLSETAVHAVNTDTAFPETAEAVKKKAGRQKKVIYRVMVAAVAAAALMAAMLKTDFFDAGTRRALPANSPVAAAKPPGVLVYHENTSGKIKTFVLPDGSRVRLSGKSELTYSEPAGGQRRTVILKGEAQFEVEKDKTKPFTVISERVSTMAVGTRFTVTAFENKKSIQVKLEEGKVLVQCGKITGQKQTGDFYLVPGQKLIYDKVYQTAKITAGSYGTPVPAAAHKRQNGPAHRPPLPFDDRRSWFMFNNQSLAETFYTLESMYDVKIVYERKDIARRYFIGRFHRSDSIENVLQQIAVLNQLTVTKHGNTFIISRSK